MAANLLILFDIWQLLDSFFSKNVDCIQPFLWGIGSPLESRRPYLNRDAFTFESRRINA